MRSRPSGPARAGSRTPTSWLRPPGPTCTQGVTVLIKGSRVNRLERVAAALAAPGTANAGGVH